MSAWSWWLDNPTLTSAVMRLGSFVKTQGEKEKTHSASSLELIELDTILIWKKDAFPTQEPSFVVRNLWRGPVTNSRSNLVVEFLFSFKNASNVQELWSRWQHHWKSQDVIDTLAISVMLACLCCLLCTSALSRLMFLSFSFPELVWSVLVLPLR